MSPYLVQGQESTGYGAQFSNSSSRLNLRYIDVPQTVNVVSSEFLEDAGLFDSRDFIKYVNNIAARTNAHQVETFFVRGLQTSQSYVDGFLVAFPTSRDSALIDRVEYVKGPASAAMGRGEAAGLVNYVSKSPLPVRRDTYSVIAGSDSFYRTQFDHNGLLGTSGTMTYRVPVYFEDGDSTRGGSTAKLFHIKKYGIGPSFRWEITPRTELLIHSGIYRYEGPGSIGTSNWADKDIYRARLATGLNSAFRIYEDPFLDPRIAHGYYGAARISDNAEISASLVHKFTDVISFRGGARWENTDERFIQQNISSALARNPADPTDLLASLTMSDNFRNGDGARGQGDLLFDKTIGSTEHQFLVGFDAFNNYGYQKSGSRGGVQQSLYHPDPAGGPAGFSPDTWVTNYTTDRYTDSEGFAYYGQYSGSFFHDKISVMAGWREDTTSQSLHNNRNDTTTPSEEQTTHVPRYSITYKPLESMSVYYLHSEQADPANTQDRFSGFRVANGATQWDLTDPRYDETLTSAVRAELNEIGAKMNLLDNRVTLSAALFSLDRTGLIKNVLVDEVGANGMGTLTYNRWFTVSGESVRGFEAELFGQPTPRLTLSASYGGMSGTTIDAKNERADIPNLVSTAGVFGKYSLLDSQKNGFEFFFGAKLYFKGWLVLGGTPVVYSRDQYTLDAGISYQFRDGRNTIALKSTNLTDEFVLLNVNSQLPYRRVFLSFSGRF